MATAASANGPRSISVDQLMALLKRLQAQIGLLKVLVIRDSAIPTLGARFFDGLFIRRVELADCGIASVERGAFAGLESVLQELALPRNRLVRVPTAAIAGLSALTKLDLSYNEIGELAGEDALPRFAKVGQRDLLYLI